MPKEKVWEEQYAQQRAQQERRAAFAQEQLRAEREAQAAAQRARRGVTPLWNALQLPVGQREDQLLYDFNASGSGFATVNSRRLPTLEEGSAEHAKCVNVVRKEIRLRGNVTSADRARQVSAYAARQREAAQLRPCGCCGTRDPSMWYSEQKRLHELPMDHWARIDDAAYADLLNANVLELMNVSEEKVPVPRVEWHNCFECGGSAYHVIPGMRRPWNATKTACHAFASASTATSTGAGPAANQSASAGTGSMTICTGVERPMPASLQVTTLAACHI